MRVIKAPERWSCADNERSLFLSGSIEMGQAELWQDSVIESLEDLGNIVVLNPRRDDWDSTWEQNKRSPKFREQVEWELNSLERASYAVVYFASNTRSSISLFEFGLLLHLYKVSVVYCPKDFWRKGNIDIVCELYGISITENKGQFLNLIHDCMSTVQLNLGR